MTYIKYNIENDVTAQLDLWIWASTTTINLKSWEGTQFPSADWIIRFVQYNTPADTTSGIAKSENILITNKSWDILTVTRWFGWDTPTTFLADDYVYLTNHKAVIEDIQDEVTRLESAKLNIWALRTALSNTWKLFFSNWSNNEAELWLWANGTYLRSNWTAANPSWWTPPLDVYWQTTITTVDRAADYITVSDWSDSNNTKKLLVNKIADEASTTQKWLVEMCTNTEATTWTDESRYINAKQAKDNYSSIFDHIIISRLCNLSSWSTVHSHSLWKVPSKIEFFSIAPVNGSYSSSWSYVNWTTTNYCVYQNTGSSPYAYSDTTKSIRYANYLTWYVSAVSSTNFTITWSAGTASSTNIRVIANLTA